jgi:hypothetical protein
MRMTELSLMSLVGEELTSELDMLACASRSMGIAASGTPSSIASRRRDRDCPAQNDVARVRMVVHVVVVPERLDVGADEASP